MENDEKNLNQKENEEIVEKDNLMWNEEDYQVMEKITGFDSESVEKDQKKTLGVIIFSFICIVLLTIGILIGYNLPRKKEDGFIVTHKPTDETSKLIESAYTRKNTSGELYLYLKDSNDEEYSILDLSKYNAFHYNYYNEKLYVLLENDELTLLEFALSDGGYKSNTVEIFKDKSDVQVFFVNNLIYFVSENQVSYYDIIAKKSNNLEADFKDCFILSINEKYILYSRGDETKLYTFADGQEILISKNVLLASLEDNNKILYFTKERSENTVMLYEYLIDTTERKFVTEVANDNAMIVNYKNLYLYNDANKIYLYDGGNNKKIYEFTTTVAEISYINDEEIIFVSSEYDSENCALTENKVGVFNVNTKKVSERTINGCLDTAVINNVIFVK